MRIKKYNKRAPILQILVILVVALLLAGCGTTAAQTPTPANPDIILSTTTSTVDSGLLDYLVPIFEKQTGYKVKIIANGTGAALAMGDRGDADVLLVHAPASEKALIDDNSGINYQLVMHNDFIIVGPSDDPAKIIGMKTAAEALKAISDSQSTFISRGDDSGTNKKELEIWKKAGIEPSGKWYQESGSGMGQTLTMTSEKNAYTITDRATYLANKKNLNLDIMVEGDGALLNIYHVMQVNPEKFPKVNKDGAKAFVDFMINPDTQKLIGDFGKDQYGQALFFADAGKKDSDLGL